METPLKKKGAWRVPEIMVCLDSYLQYYNCYKGMKKSGQAKGFHDQMCDVQHVPRGSTENLLKNLGREYRDVVRTSMQTGAETITPKLRGSAELYLKYEEYQLLYFPAGGQVKPKAVITEIGVTALGCTFAGASGSSCAVDDANEDTEYSTPKKRRIQTKMDREDELLTAIKSLVESNKKIAIELQTIRMVMATHFGVEVREEEEADK